MQSGKKKSVAFRIVSALALCFSLLAAGQLSLHAAAQGLPVKRIQFSGNRPFTLFTPQKLPAKEALPLVLLLHGFTSSGPEILKYTGLTGLVNSRKYLLVAPNGSKTPTGTQFWNATPACCDFYFQKSDDAQFLTTVIGKVSKKVAVDRKRIYIIGHSNGGAMAHRMACEHSNLIAGIVSLAGPTFDKRSECQPKLPVSVLQIWGTSDEVLNYKGGKLFDVPYPGAQKSAQNWATINQCKRGPNHLATTKDYFPGVKGAETQITSYSQCSKTTNVTLWTGKGMSHVPELSSKTMKVVLSELFSHHR